MRSRLSWFSVIVLVVLVLSTACTSSPTETSEDAQVIPSQAPATKTIKIPTTKTMETDEMVETTSTNMPNPASAYCEARGYRLGTRTDANDGQYSVCVFPDLAECEEWAFFRGECQMGIDLTGWLEYTNPQYGFAFRRPPGWELEEVQGPDNTMADHQVKLHIRPEANREIEMIISFKRVGEEQLIWPTGVGEGEFVDRGPAWLMAEPVKRNVLLCEGQDMSVYYQQESGVQRGDLEFAIILGYVGSCADGYSIPIAIEELADAVLATFTLLP